MKITENNLKQFYTPRDVAETMSISVYTVYEMCKLGKLPAMKFGKLWRIPINKFQRWLENQMIKTRKIYPW